MRELKALVSAFGSGVRKAVGREKGALKVSNGGTGKSTVKEIGRGASPLGKDVHEALSFKPVSIKDLRTLFDKPENAGKLVTFEGSFGRETYSEAYMETKWGYKLWDREGNGLRVDNLFAVKGPGYHGPDAGRDLNAAAINDLLQSGKYVKIEGTYRPGHQQFSYRGMVDIEPKIDIYFINGRPTREYVSK